MTEAEWLSYEVDLHKKLFFLQDRVSERKLRLFMVACSRRVWNLLATVHRDAVETSERFADRLTTAEELSTTWRATRVVDGLDGLSENPMDNARFWAEDAAIQCASEWDRESAVATSVAWAISWASNHPSDVAFDAECVEQAVLLRDIIGNPFRSFAVDSSWLSWRDSTIPKLAQAIYDERAFDLLPILADALEDAGCDNADILNHCRQPGEHVRGCWVVDLLLGKE